MHDNRYSLPNRSKEPTTTATQEPLGAPVSFVDIIPLLYTQIESCPAINALYDSNKIYSYVHVFTPNVIVGLPTHISQIPEVLDESIFVLDFLAFISMSHFGNSEYLKNMITKHIASSRVIKDINESTIANSITGYLFSSVEDGMRIIENNQHLLAIYLIGFVRTATAYNANKEVR